MGQQIAMDLTFERKKFSWRLPGGRGPWPPHLDMLRLFGPSKHG
jgi:hypothetical protein